MHTFADVGHLVNLVQSLYNAGQSLNSEAVDDKYLLLLNKTERIVNEKLSKLTKHGDCEWITVCEGGEEITFIVETCMGVSGNMDFPKDIILTFRYRFKALNANDLEDENLYRRVKKVSHAIKEKLKHQVKELVTDKQKFFAKYSYDDTYIPPLNECYPPKW